MDIRMVSPYVEIYRQKSGIDILKDLEQAGRTCYKSEEKMTENSAVKFIKSILQSGHESVIEHATVSARIICDRGVSHEIVRHRLFSYSQESTRYVNYKNHIEFIAPCFWANDSIKRAIWEYSVSHDASAYYKLLDEGATPQEARSILPNSLKTEIVMTGNLRNWRHFLKLRCSSKAHPQMREIALLVLKQMHEYIPVIFDDLADSYLTSIG